MTPFEHQKKDDIEATVHLLLSVWLFSRLRHHCGFLCSHFPHCWNSKMADVIFVKAVACSLSASHFGSPQIAWNPSQLGTKKSTKHQRVGNSGKGLLVVLLIVLVNKYTLKAGGKFATLS